MKKILLLALIVNCCVVANAQFILKGKIEYEKTVNQHKQMDSDEDDSWAATIKKTIPEFRRTYFNLQFSGNKTIYQPGRETTEKVSPWGEGPASANIIYSDFAEGKTVAAKQVFDESFLIQDSVRKYNWRITGDTRKIAGFECKRATTVIMDSIFVVAFYTEEIISQGGPESFNGLPGVILGIVIPRMFTNWYATKLELEEVKDAALAPPKKGKKTDYKGIDKTIQDSLKRWGKWGTKYIWQIMI